MFGSCRVGRSARAALLAERRTRTARGREIDALHTLALQMRDEPRERWPDVLLMIGDQVYADEVSPGTQAFIETRRDPSEPPGERVVDFEDYTQLYLESWSEPAIRWLLSTVSTAMIFDDHDVHDDWNISQAWLEEMREHEWWNEHIKAALCLVLGLPAPRQPVARVAPGGRAAEAGQGRPTTPRTCSRRSPSRPTARPPARAGATAATSATRA